MRGKLLFVTGAAVGYVLGARAGRKRYDQIAAAASKVWQSPGIQKQVSQAQDYAAAKVGDIPDALFTGARKLISQAASNRTKPTRSVVVTTPAGDASQTADTPGAESATSTGPTSTAPSDD